MKDPRRALGVARGASLDDVRRAYRRIVFANHPDRNSSPAAAVRLRRAREAYDALRAELERPPEAIRAAPQDARATFDAAAARAFSTFVDELAAGVSAETGVVELELGGASVRVTVSGVRATPRRR